MEHRDASRTQAQAAPRSKKVSSGAISGYVGSDVLASRPIQYDKIPIRENDNVLDGDTSIPDSPEPPVISEDEEDPEFETDESRHDSLPESGRAKSVQRERAANSVASNPTEIRRLSRVSSGSYRNDPIMEVYG